jgi:hypothetical protein
VSGESASRSPNRRNYDPEHRRVVIGPMMTLSEFKRRLNAALNEYFISEDLPELIQIVTSLSCPEYHYDIVKRAISLSLDRTDREREMVSPSLSFWLRTLTHLFERAGLASFFLGLSEPASNRANGERV